MRESNFAPFQHKPTAAVIGFCGASRPLFRTQSIHVRVSHADLEYELKSTYYIAVTKVRAHATAEPEVI